jgi:hypothetical protein
VSTATLAGHRVTHARVNLPAWGIPWADASIDEEIELSGVVSLVVADLTLTATVMSGGPGPKGRSSFRLAAGAGKWGKTIPPKSYANDFGIKASTVLADAATACGETLDAATLPATRLGPAWARESGPAAKALEQLSPAAWYVGEDGITRIGRRPATALATPATVGSVDKSRAVIELAAESIAAIVPGITVEGIEAVDVLHEVTPAGGLRSTLWGAGISSTSRRLAAWRRIADQLDPSRRFRGVFEYRIVTQDTERANLQPIRVSVGMPDLQRVYIRPGVPGTRADHTLGSRVLVGFIDGDPSRPAVLGFEDAEGGGFLPIKLEITATAAIEIGGVAGLPSARQTDPVQAGPFTGVITGPCSPKVKVG